MFNSKLNSQKLGFISQIQCLCSTKAKVMDPAIYWRSINEIKSLYYFMHWLS